MNSSHSESYKKAGVDITAGYEAVRRMQAHIGRTTTKGVLSPIGGFSGMFAPNISGMSEPVLVSGTDGVGTKLKLAFAMNKHNSVGIDCVAMCVNDIICSGAKPLFFLDYVAVGKLSPEQVEQIVSGVSDGCVEAGCALIGGETAEMPGFYPDGEYDLAGFAVGIVDKADILDPQNTQAGDVLLALPSSGPHSNGFSLIRKAFDIDNHPEILFAYHNSLGSTLGEALLAPTQIYVNAVEKLLANVRVHSLAHITGGGFYENIPRCLPKNLHATIQKNLLRVPPVFDMIQSAGKISEHDMFNTFNMGVGLCAAIPMEDANKAIAALNELGMSAYVMGELTQGERGITIC